MRSLYDILGVEKGATDAEIRSAYRDKAKTLHPDMPGGSKQAFSEVASAYLVLINPTKRQEYDTTGRARTEAENPDNGPIQIISGKLQELLASGDDIFKHDLVKVIVDSINTELEAGANGQPGLKVQKRQLEAALARADRLLDERRFSGAKVMVIESTLRWHKGEIEGALDRCNGFIAMRERALEILRDVTFRKDEPEIFMTMFGQPPAFTSGTAGF